MPAAIIEYDKNTSLAIIVIDSLVTCWAFRHQDQSVQQYSGLHKMGRGKEADPRRQGRTRWEMTYKRWVSTGKRPSLLLVTAENGDHLPPSVPMGTGGSKSKSKSLSSKGQSSSLNAESTAANLPRMIHCLHNPTQELCHLRAQTSYWCYKITLAVLTLPTTELVMRKSKSTTWGHCYKQYYTGWP